MLKDPFDYLAIFDGFHSTRDELLRIQSAIDDRAKIIAQSADEIAGVVQLWRAEGKDLVATIGRDVEENGYVALEKYVDTLHATSLAEVREIAAAVETTLQQIASSATEEWRALSTAQQDMFHRQLNDIAAAANGLPPLPPRPVTSSVFGNCAYFLKLALVRARRFCIEAKSYAAVVSAAALIFIALQFVHGPISLPSSLFR